MVKQIFALLFVAIFLSPSFTTSVTEMCVTPVCRCSSYLSYNVTVICHTDDVKNDLNHSIKKPEEIVALYVNSYDSLFYILSFFFSFRLLCYSLKSSLKMFLSTSVKNLVSPLNWRGKMRDIFMSVIIANAEKTKNFHSPAAWKMLKEFHSPAVLSS